MSGKPVVIIFIRSAVVHTLADLERRALERDLAEGYRANAALDRQICRDFSHVDGENI